MARKLRLECEGGIYHVINRGNYRSAIFRSDRTKAAFLKCLGETCMKVGWHVHAWCIMSNHYHLAIETPQANLVEGMRWLQGTFSTRFNRLRKTQGHLFQGRYKSLFVDPGTGLGPLCHYIHLNPVRAKVVEVEALPDWPWSSLHRLHQPRRRESWYDPDAALEHAGGLPDTSAGHRRYLRYLGWLAEDDTACKRLKFEEMSRGWVIGSHEFKRDLLHEQKAAAGRGVQLAGGMREAVEAVWEARLREALKALGRREAELERSGKSEPWKLAVAAGLKQRTTVTNRWLSTRLHLGNLYEVSRKVAAWLREPDRKLCQQLQITPNHKA